MQFTRTCPITRKTTTMDLPVTPEQVAKWEGGALIQHVMPDLTDDQREFILTGISPEGWDRLFGDD